MEPVGYHLVQDAGVRLGETDLTYKLSFASQAGSAFPEARWRRPIEYATRTEIQEIAGDWYICGHKIGNHLDSCYLSLEPTRGEKGEYPAIWHSCPVTPLELHYPQGRFQPFIFTEYEGARLYLGREGHRALFMPGKAMEGLNPIRTARHELLMHVDLESRRVRWVFRHYRGDPWRAGEVLPANLGDELDFFLAIDRQVPVEAIRQVTIDCHPLSGEAPPTPWSAFDMVAAGSAYSNSVFAPGGTLRPPSTGPSKTELGSLYGWGDVISLQRPGLWEIKASVDLQGVGRLGVDPKMCVGGGCNGVDCYMKWATI